MKRSILTISTLVFIAALVGSLIAILRYGIGGVYQESLSSYQKRSVEWYRVRQKGVTLVMTPQPWSDKTISRIEVARLGIAPQVYELKLIQDQLPQKTNVHSLHVYLNGLHVWPFGVVYGRIKLVPRLEYPILVECTRDKLSIGVDVCIVGLDYHFRNKGSHDSYLSYYKTGPNDQDFERKVMSNPCNNNEISDFSHLGYQSAKPKFSITCSNGLVFEGVLSLD